MDNLLKHDFAFEIDHLDNDVNQGCGVGGFWMESESESES